MNTKKCPYCSEEIQAEAVKCKHCGTWLTAPPAVATESGPIATTRLLRSSTDKMLAGVCGGLARYTKMDSTIVRILFALGVFFTAIVPGIIVYVILAFVIPSDDSVAL